MRYTRKFLFEPSWESRCHIKSMERELDEDNNAFNAMVMAQKIAEIREFKSRIDEYVKGLKRNKEVKNKGETK